MSGGPCPESGCQVLDTITVIGQRPSGPVSFGVQPGFTPGSSPTVSLGNLFQNLYGPKPAPPPPAPSKKPPTAAFVGPALAPVLEPIVVTAQSTATPILPVLGVIGSAALLTGAVFYGIGQLFDYAALPTARDRKKKPINYGGGPFTIPDVQIPSTDFAPVEIPDVTAPELLPEVQVTAPRPITIVPQPYEFTPSSEPGAERSRGGNVPELPHIAPLAPAVGRPAGNPRVAPAPRGTPGPDIRPRPGTTPGPGPGTAPGPAPGPATAPAPGPGTKPAPAPGPGTAPQPQPGRPGTKTKPGVTGKGGLTSPSTGGLQSPGSAPGPATDPDAAAKKAGYDCPSTKTEDETKKFGCGQGYYRETQTGITYKQWSTRKCQSSKGNSASQRQGRPITS